jgi:hypothetical protein
MACSLQVSGSLHGLTKIKTSGKVFVQFDDGGWFWRQLHVHKVTVFGSMSKSFFIIFLLDKLQESKL